MTIELGPRRVGLAGTPSSRVAVWGPGVTRQSRISPVDRCRRPGAGPRPERSDDGLGGTRADAGHLGDLGDAGRPQPLERAEVLEQRLAPRLAEPGYAVEGGVDHAARALLPVVGDREPVRLVAHPLQQVEALAGARQDHRVGVAGQPHLLEPLGQPAERDVVDAELLQRRARRLDLRGAAVDDHQVGRVGEAPRPAGLGVAGRGWSGSGPPRDRSLEIAAEPSRDHLVDAAHVVGAVLAHGPDREAAVLRLARQAVLEHDHRGHDVGALQVGHVEALDAQRRLVQAERLLDLGERDAARRQVAGPPQLVQRQRLLGVALRRSPSAPACRRAAAPAGRPCLRRSATASSATASASAGSRAPAPRGAPRRPLSTAVRPGRRQLLDQLAGGQLLDPLDDAATLPAHPAAADVEDLHGRLERVVGEAR